MINVNGTRSCRRRVGSCTHLRLVLDKVEDGLYLVHALDFDLGLSVTISGGLDHVQAALGRPCEILWRLGQLLRRGTHRSGHSSHRERSLALPPRPPAAPAKEGCEPRAAAAAVAAAAEEEASEEEHQRQEADKEACELHE